jgi:cytochrome c553
MEFALRWLRLVAVGLVALLLLVAAAIFIVSSWVIGREHEARAERLEPPTPALLADAPRQARILGCVSCHGEGLRGRLMADIPNVVRIHAPNLTQVAARSTDQQLAAAIRQGIGVDGRGLFVMPSPMYSHLSDAEVAALIAWMRGLPKAERQSEGFSARPIGRVAIVTGKLRTAPAKMEEFRSQAPIDMGAAHALGRRIANNTCSECHGPALFGTAMEDGRVTPDLTIAGAYDYEQFRTLMRTGVAPHGRDLGLMKEVARNDFSHLTDEELSALHDYLRARAEKLVY